MAAGPQARPPLESNRDGMSDAPIVPVRPRAPGRAVRSLRALAVTVLIGVVGLLTGIVLFDDVVMPRFTQQGGEVAVPDLSNLNVTQAQAALRQAGLTFTVAAERYDSAVPKGFVIAQSPAPHRRVKSGRQVAITISLGEEFASLPELFGESVRTARLLLSRAGLRVGQVGRVATSEVGPGLILATDPPSSSVVPRGTAVHLLVGAPAGAEAYVMPDLVGKDAETAAHALEELGFEVETIGPGGNFARIESQSPPPGARALRGQNIVLNVAGRLIQ